MAVKTGMQQLALTMIGKQFGMEPGEVERAASELSSFFPRFAAVETRLARIETLLLALMGKSLNDSDPLGYADDTLRLATALGNGGTGGSAQSADDARARSRAHANGTRRIGEDPT